MKESKEGCTRECEGRKGEGKEVIIISKGNFRKLLKNAKY